MGKSMIKTPATAKKKQRSSSCPSSSSSLTCGHSTNQHAQERLRIEIAVADRRHGDHVEPQGIGNRIEHVLVGIARGHAFGVVDQRGKDAHGDQHEEDQQPEHGRGVFHRGDDHFQAGMMIEQFEQPHDAYGREEIERFVVVHVQLRQRPREVEPERGEKIDDVQNGLGEFFLVRTDDESRDDFEDEPGIT